MSITIKASVFGALITGILGIAGTYMTIHSQISEKDAEIAKLARDYAERTDLSHTATLARIDALTVKADQRISDLRKEYDDRMAMSDTENSFEKYRLHAEYVAKIRSLVRGSYAERRLDLKPYEVKRDQRIIADFEDSFPMKDFFMFLEKTANEGQRSYLAALTQKRRDADYDLSVYLASIPDEIVEESPYVRDKKLAFYTNLVRKTSIADQANAEFFSAVGSLTSRKARN